MILPYRISELFARSRPDLFFVYGYDVAHKGAFGQAVSMVGLDNSSPVYTCWKMCKSSGYFSDSQYDEICMINKMAIDKILMLAKKRFIIPLRKIGCGYSRMNEFAPKAFNALNRELDIIKCPIIEWKYE